MNFRNSKNHRGLIQRTGDNIDFVPVKLSTSGFKDSLCHTCAGKGSCPVVGAALEAVGGVGVQEVTLGTLPNGGRIKPRRFDEDILCLRRDHGVESAHDTGEGDWFLCVRDD